MIKCMHSCNETPHTSFKLTTFKTSLFFFELINLKLQCAWLNNSFQGFMWKTILNPSHIITKIKSPVVLHLIQSFFSYSDI